MIKDMKIAWKISGGYGLLIIITCALGALGISNMAAVENKARTMARAYVPEVEIANSMERNVLLTMFNMRGYALSDNEEYYKAGAQFLTHVKENLQQAMDLVSSQPGLEKLQANIAELDTKILHYEELSRKTDEASRASITARRAMDALAVESVDATNYLLRGQNDMMRFEIAAGSPEEDLEERRVKISLIMDAIDMCYATRIVSLKAHGARKFAMFAPTEENFAQLDKFFVRLNELARNQGESRLLETAQAAMARYREAVNALAANIKSIEDANAQREHAAEEMLSLAQTVAEDGLQQTSIMASDADASLDLATKLLASGLAIAIVLAIIIAVTLTRNIIGPLARLVTFANTVAKGDLNSSLSEKRGDELGKLADAIRSMVAGLKQRMEEAARKSEEADNEARRAQQAMREAEEAGKAALAGREAIVQAAEQLQGVAAAVTSASEELSAQIEQSSRGAEVQTQRTGEAATAMEQMTASVMEVASNAGGAAQTAGNARTKAQGGAEIVRRAVRQIGEVQDQSMHMKADMAKLDKQAEDIGQIMNVISDIADQTNLLALNAAIEAARAGEAGRGFAVVADEVRKLAEKTMSATSEVGAAIRGIQEGTRTTVQNVEHSAQTIAEATRLSTESGDSLDEIVKLVVDVSDQVQTIATAAEEQSAASEQISRSVEEVNTISSETAQAMGQAAHAIAELADQTMNLKTLIDDMLAKSR